MSRVPNMDIGISTELFLCQAVRTLDIYNTRRGSCRRYKFCDRKHYWVFPRLYYEELFVLYE
jgi:hypothetical protein